MKKIKKLFQTKIFYFILGVLVCGTISVTAATYFPSNDVTYDNTVSGLQSTDVQGAIDELYNTCFPPEPPGGGDYILDKVDIVTSGDGLYEDEYEEGRYFYKGAYPDNYIIFSGETWRILSIEADGRIKIVKNTSIGERAWDSSNSNDWSRPATLNTYLNGEYKSTLSDKDKIATSTWNIGGIPWTDTDLSLTISKEKSRTWSGDIALITASEYIRSNSNKDSCGTMDQVQYLNYSPICDNTTWLHFDDSYWVLTPYSGDSKTIYILDKRYGLLAEHTANAAYDLVQPALYLQSDVKLSGKGISSNPFIIE